MKINAWLRKFNLLFVLAIGFALVTVRLPIASSSELTTTEKGLMFLADAVGLAMPSYNVEGGVIHPDGPFGSEYVKYVLESNGSKIDVIFILKGEDYLWCSLSSHGGSPLFAQPRAGSAVDEAKSFLEKYENYSRASYVQSMRDTLDSTSELTPMSTAVGDVRFEVSTEETITSITWMNAVNGITNTYDVVLLTLRNGTFWQFCDSWNLYKIGSADVKVGQPEAVRIAKENAYITAGSDGDIKFTNFSIVDWSIRAELKMQPRKDGKLYPNWAILFGLDKVYFGGVTGIQVSLWADTGGVEYVGNLGSYGTTSTGENATTPPEQSPSQSSPPSSSPPVSTPPENNSTPTSTYVVATLASIAAATAVAAVVLKKRSR